MRRTLALWLVLFGAYAATLGLDAFGDSDYGGDEPHYLLAVESLVDDRDLDVRDEYAERAYADFYPYDLERRGQETDGRLNEPLGIGFPLLLVPAWPLGGAVAVELFLAALAALAVVLASRLARHVVPDPWAIGASAAVGLSPPFLAYGAAVYPELSAGAALAGAALLTIRLDARPAWPPAFGCFALLGTLPWLGLQFVPAGLVIGFFAARAVWRARKRTLALGAVELSLFSVALYVGLNEAFYGGPTPYAAQAEGETATGASSPGGYLERAHRLVALFIDREYGLLRWAPVFALAFAGLWWLWRSHRDRLARAVPQLREIELTADLCAAVLGVQLLVAAFLAPTMFGFWFPARHLVAALPLAIPLVGWGLRHAPRVGSALAALTVAASVWLYLDLRFAGGSFATQRPDAPWGPLEGTFPSFGLAFPLFGRRGHIPAPVALPARGRGGHGPRPAGVARARQVLRRASGRGRHGRAEGGQGREAAADGGGARGLLRDAALRGLGLLPGASRRHPRGGAGRGGGGRVAPGRSQAARPGPRRGGGYALPMITPTMATSAPPTVTWTSERVRDTARKRLRIQAISSNSIDTTA
jgi:hypothetical protein